MRRYSAMLVALLMLLMAAAPAVAAAPARARAGGSVIDPAGRALPGAEVEIYLLGHGLAAVVETGPDGRFAAELSGGAGALYFLRAAAPGYRTLETGWTDAGRMRQQVLQMDPLFGSVQVTVVDELGEPVPAQVTVAAPGGRYAQQTTRAGTARFDQLQAGSYQVAAVAAGYRTAVRTGDLKAGSNTVALLVLQRLNGYLWGSVRDAVTGAVVPEAVVELLRSDDTVAFRTRGTLEGRFAAALPGAESGPFRLRAVAPGYRPAVGAPISLPAGQAESGLADLRLEPVAGTLAGVVVNAGGVPMADIPVVIEQKGYGEVDTVRTDADGTFRLGGLPAAAARQYRALVLLDDMLVAGEWLTLAPGAVTDVTLQRRNYGAESFSYRTLTGTVQDTAGRPVKGARVEVLGGVGHGMSASTKPDGTFVLEQVPAGARSDPPVALRISGEGYAATTEVVLENTPVTLFQVPNDKPIRVRATLTPNFPPVRGRVSDAVGGALAGARVSLLVNGGAYRAEAVTDGAGWYQFRAVPALPGSVISLSAEAEGFSSRTAVDSPMEAGDQVSVPVVALSRSAGVLTGLVTDPSGEAVAAAAVKVTGHGGGIIADAVTDDAGRYRLSLPAGDDGPALLTVRKAGWEGRAVLLEALPEPGKVKVLNLPLQMGSAALTGQVLRADGEPARNVRVRLLEDARGTVATVTTNEHGVYRFESVPLDGTGWFWLRVDASYGIFAGSLRHGTELVPLMRLLPGAELVTDLQVR